MDLPTYTSIWRIEKRLYKLYDFRLPMPVPVGQIAVFAAITVPYVILLTVLGLPFNHTLFWLYVLPPGVITWLATRPVLESKRLPELIISQVRYLGEPATWCRMRPLVEKDDIVLIGRIWRRAEVPDQIPAPSPAPAAAPATAPARRPAPAPAPAGTAAPAKRPSAAPVRAGAQRIPVAQSGPVARPAAFAQAIPAGPAPARPQSAPGIRADGARRQARLPESVRAARQVWETPRNPAARAAAAADAALASRPSPAAGAASDTPLAPEEVTPAPVPVPPTPEPAEDTLAPKLAEDAPAEAAPAASAPAVSAPAAPAPAAPATPDQAAPPGLAQAPPPTAPPIVVVGAGSARPALVERALGGPGQHRAVTSWREHVRVVPGGHRPGRPDMEQRDRARVQQPIPGPRLIAVLGCTVGAGQTVTTLMLSDVLASLRGEPVAALDLNPGPTSLAGLACTLPAATVRGLLASPPPAAPAPRRGRLDLIAQDVEAPGEGLSDPDCARLLRIITDRYMLTLTDPAASAVARLLSAADQLVLVAPASAEASRAVAMTMEWLDGHGFAELCAGAVAVINGVSKRSMAHVEQAELVVRGRCRATVRVPWDEYLAGARTIPRTTQQTIPRTTQRTGPLTGRGTGNGRLAQAAESRFGQLRPQAQLAYTALAGVLVSALAADQSAAPASAPGRTAAPAAAASRSATPAPGNGEHGRASQ